MKNKTKIAFLTTILTVGFTLGACGPAASSSQPGSSQSSDNSSQVAGSSSQAASSSQGASSSQTTSSSIPVVKHTVNFVVEGETVQTTEVEEGELAEYTGARPEKDPVSETQRYKFTGWDNNIKQPITQDTTFTAQFQLAEYTPVVMIDNFESYNSSGAMNEAWSIKMYSGDAWVDTSASISVGHYAKDGEKALRMDAWENGTGFRISKAIAANTYNQNVNALKFCLKVPKINTVRAIVEGSIPGLTYKPRFLYEIKPTSNDYVEYTIPLSSPNLKDSSGKSLKQMATDYGLHEDDLLKVLSSVDFFFQGDDKVYDGNGWPYIAFLDSVKFVTINNPEEAQVENWNLYKTYTGNHVDGKPVRFDFVGGTVTMKRLAQAGQPVLEGNYSSTNDNVTICLMDNDNPTYYTGSLTDAGKTLTLNYNGDQLVFTAVQAVDNFEQYETDGQAYYASKPAEERSGCRGAYYSEYYKGSGESPWGKGGWSLMEGNGDQLKLMQDATGAHSGNQYLSLKHAKDKAMRYMQWGLFDGSSVNKDGYRGSKFSFWAKSDGWVKYFKVYMYSQPAPTLSTLNNYVKVTQFEESQAISEWKHYEIELNPNISYYGYMIMIEKNYDLGASQAYLFIDDVEVYGDDPYYVPAV